MKKMEVSDDSIITVELGNKIITLKSQHFDSEINMDEVLNIQYYNIVGEILTFPVVMNRIGNLRAEMEEVVAKAKLDFQIFEADMQEKKRKEMTGTILDGKGKEKIDKPTKDEVENAVILSPEYKVKKNNLFSIQKNFAYIESLFWSAKDKSAKLDVLSAKLKPEDFEKEIMEGTLNGVVIKFHKKSIE